tara:strand:+ start:3427 stop:3705 length:279 start_codon:yes stop_codon:yes gene_type:complete
MSVTHFLFGASAMKDCFRTFGAAILEGPEIVGVGENFFDTLLVSPIYRIALLAQNTGNRVAAGCFQRVIILESIGDFVTAINPVRLAVDLPD